MNTRVQALTQVLPTPSALEASNMNDAGYGMEVWLGTPKTQGSVS